jgi:protein-ribulosamine 3-kinase
MAGFAAIARELTTLTGLNCAAAPARAVGGGSINQCYRWEAGRTALFVKVAGGEARDRFSAEAAGLNELAAARALRVPRVLACGGTEQDAFLALEWIEAGAAGRDSERQLGAGLARLHAVTAPRFGFPRDNHIGRTPQRNDWSDDWAGFFAAQRLGAQLRLAATNGFAAQLGPTERLLECVARLLHGHHPRASLLHGDLWGGNWLTAVSGEPVIYDPAVYYGDAETDIAMTRLFGGFGTAFYQAYEAAVAPCAGAPLRRQIYNLYHVLNHANLFGGGYIAQARESCESLLAENGC